MGEIIIIYTCPGTVASFFSPSTERPLSIIHSLRGGGEKMIHSVFETEKAIANLWLCLIFGGLVSGLLYAFYIISVVTGYVQYLPTLTLPYAFWFQGLHLITAGPLMYLHSKPRVRLFNTLFYAMCIQTGIDLGIMALFIISVFIRLGQLSTIAFIYMAGVSIVLAFLSFLVTLHLYPMYEELEIERKKNNQPKRQ